MKPQSRQDWAVFLALNRTVGIILIAVLFFGLGEEMWSPFMGIYLDAQTDLRGRAHDLVEPISWAALITIGVYAFLRNLFEGVCYIGGGQLTHRLGDKGSLILFALLTITGYFLFLVTSTSVVAVIAAILILGWEPLSVPVTFTTVGSTVSSSGQGMAFALQSIQKRLPKIVGPVIAGFIIGTAERILGDPVTSRVVGMRYLVAGALVLGVTSLAIQIRWMPQHQAAVEGPSSWRILRDLHPVLRRLLVAEIFTRWCDWLVREFVVVYLILVRGVEPLEVGILLAVQNLTALATYLPIGRLTQSIGLQPFIGVTFFFFAIFPLVLALVPDGGWLYLAFVVYGLRETGEPARKALITSLIPEDSRARGVGLYWGIRAFALCSAAPVGAVIWYHWGPVTLLYTAFGMGCVGWAVFYFFCRDADRRDRGQWNLVNSRNAEIG